MATKTKIDDNLSAKLEVLPDVTDNISDEEKMACGKALIGEGKYLQAIEFFAVLTDKGDQYARKCLAFCHYNLENYDVAYQHLNYIAENSDGELRDYCISVNATIELMYGNIDKAIRMLKSLPKNPINILNLSLMYWKKGVSYHDELSVQEALKTLNFLNIDTLNTNLLFKYYHLKGFIYQAQQSYKLAENFYNQALNHATNDVEKGMILNDTASLFIELKQFEKAEATLSKAYNLVVGKSVLHEAFNHKWLGFLYFKVKQYEKSKEHFKITVKTLKDKNLIEHVAGIAFLLADLVKKNRGPFYEAAKKFAEGVRYERLLEEVKERDEKIIDFYFNSFVDFNDQHNSTS